MPIEKPEDDYLDRCISATNLYVETFNKNMSDLILKGEVLPLDKEYKKRSFRSMTGQDWLDEYDGIIRWDQINKVSRTIDRGFGNESRVDS